MKRLETRLPVSAFAENCVSCWRVMTRMKIDGSANYSRNSLLADQILQILDIAILSAMCCLFSVLQNRPSSPFERVRWCSTTTVDHEDQHGMSRCNVADFVKDTVCLPASFCFSRRSRTHASVGWIVLYRCIVRMQSTLHSPRDNVSQLDLIVDTNARRTARLDGFPRKLRVTW